MERAAARAFPRASHPADQEPTTHAEVETGHRARTWNYSLNITFGLILQSCSSLTTCDLASHIDFRQSRSGKGAIVGPRPRRRVRLVAKAIAKGRRGRKVKRSRDGGTGALETGVSCLSRTACIAVGDYEQQQITPKVLTLHADRGAPQRAKPVQFLLADLGVTKTHSRPYTPLSTAHRCSAFATPRPSLRAEPGRSRGTDHGCSVLWKRSEKRHPDHQGVLVRHPGKLLMPPGDGRCYRRDTAVGCRLSH